MPPVGSHRMLQQLLAFAAASCMVCASGKATSELWSEEFIKDREWRIHRLQVPPKESLNPFLLHAMHDIAIEDARDWCKQQEECVAFSFPLETSLSMITVDPVVFLRASALESNKTNETAIAEINNYGSWVVHSLIERSSTPPQNKENGTVAFNPYRRCCDKLRHLREVPTQVELSEAENIQRVPCDISRQEFVERFESRNVPVVLEGCANHWPAQKRWDSLEALSFSNDTVWMNMCKGRLTKWAEAQEDIERGHDLCIFDEIEEQGNKSQLLNDYEVPFPFRGGDFYKAAAPSVPLGRMAWFSAGHPFFGTMPHQDFHLPATESWNTLVSGAKWWVLFPPTAITMEGEWNLKCDPGCSFTPSPQIREWFLNVAYHARKFFYEDGKRPLLFLQRPGDTVYLPNRWLHSLLNLECSIAVTEAYGSVTNLAQVWKQVLVKGDETEWTKLYYSVFNAEQRKIAREAVKGEEEGVCVEHFYRLDPLVDEPRTLCRKHRFLSRVRK